jgi:hypothetical protein
MRSASVSEVGGRTGASAALLVLPVVAGTAVLAKTLLMEQPLGTRTMLLAAIAAMGALLAALPLAGLAALLTRRWRPWVRGGLGALWMAAAFIPATMFMFAIEIRLIEGRIEADSVTDLSVRDLFWTLFGGMGLFTPTGLHYLLPWPLLAVALAAFACFYRWPQPPSGVPK